MMQFNVPTPDNANWIPLYCPSCKKIVGLGLFDGQTIRVQKTGATKCPHVQDKWKPYIPQKRVQRFKKPPVIWTPTR